MDFSSWLLALEAALDLPESSARRSAEPSALSGTVRVVPDFVLLDATTGLPEHEPRAAWAAGSAPARASASVTATIHV